MLRLRNRLIPRGRKERMREGCFQCNAEALPQRGLFEKVMRDHSVMASAKSYVFAARSGFARVRHPMVPGNPWSEEPRIA